MKKIISLILTLVLVLSMSITAFAAEGGSGTINEDSQNFETLPVLGTYVPLADAETVYYLDVAWGSMEFTYKVPADVWNGETHSYESGGEAVWTYETGANVVTVTNRSNAAVVVTVTTDMGNSGITATVTNGSFTLGDASDGATTETAGTATSGFASIILSGELTDTRANKSTIGNVTVTMKEKGKDENLILDHTRGTEIVYVWSEDHTTCTAYYNCICVIGSCDYLFEQETANAVTSKETYGTWHTATFNNTALGVAKKLVGYQYNSNTNTYSVWDEDGLNIWRLAVANNNNTNLTLMDDITLSTDGITVDENGKPSGSNWTPVDKFNGIVEGKGYSITNLRIYGDNASFIETTLASAVIQNLTLQNPVVYGTTSNVGGVTNSLYGKMTNCHVVGGSVTGESDYVGGLVGYLGNSDNNTPIIYGCTNSAKVTANTDSAGGIFGVNLANTSYVVACANTGKISGTKYFGGIGGAATTANVVACYTTQGNLLGDFSNATITACYYVADSDTDGASGTTAVTKVNTSDVVSAMNSAIDTYNTNATTTVTYKWDVDNGTLVLVKKAAGGISGAAR